MEALESTLTTKGSCAEVTRKGARMPWLVKEDIQRGLFHKEPEIPIIQNSFQMLQQVCLRFYCQS